MKAPVDFLVIVPTYKRPRFLRDALESVRAQEGVTIQIIVADDCPDGSAAPVVAEFPEALGLRNPDPTGGWPGRVRNFALDAARERGITARFVHFLDDDDTVPVGHYERVADIFERHPTVGVLFGVMRPFCAFSDDPARRERQELQLRSVQSWRVGVTRFPWLYDEIPLIRQWLYRLHAAFGPEMFLCSAAVISYDIVMKLGGFPEVRLTEDYWFFTEAIRKYGALFLKRETAGYGLGDAGALWNPLDLDAQKAAMHREEWLQAIKLRKRKLKAEMGVPMYYCRKVVFHLGKNLLARIVIPALDRRGYFVDLHRIITHPSAEGTQFADQTPV